MTGKNAIAVCTEFPLFLLICQYILLKALKDLNVYFSAEFRVAKKCRFISKLIVSVLIMKGSKLVVVVV